MRDVEIALVLAREMKSAADRNVDASLRLEQLREVFGAESLDSGERARIQTALQMAGLDPRPSLLEAEPGEPIRFAIDGEADAPVEEPREQAAVEPAPAEPQEFPTVGGFARSAFRRFRGRRDLEAIGDGDEVTTATEHSSADAEPPPEEPAAAPAPEAPLEEEPEPEPVPAAEEPAPIAADEPVAEEPAPMAAEEAAANGHVDVASNGHSNLDFDGPAAAEEEEHVTLPDPEVEHALYTEPEPAAYEPDSEPEPAPDPDPEPALEPAAYSAAPDAARPRPAFADIASVLLPIVIVPVLIASFAGWSFGLPFAALALVATGLAARRAIGPRAILTGAAAVTAAALAVGAVLSGVGTTKKSSTAKRSPARQPAAPTHRAPSKAAARPPARAKKVHKRAHRRHRAASNPPDNSTRGLILVPPHSSSAPRAGTPTTPGATPTTPGATPTTPGAAQQPSPAQPGTGR